MEWLATVEWSGVGLVLLVVLPLVGLFVRRRWLTQRGAVFDCALHLEDGRRRGWALGLARYDSVELLWYRTFSLSVRPRLVLLRDRTTSLGQRAASDGEAGAMFTGDRVVKIRSMVRGQPRTYELAMSPGAMTGLMSWLEAAPPGGDAYSGLGEFSQD